MVNLFLVSSLSFVSAIGSGVVRVPLKPGNQTVYDFAFSGSSIPHGFTADVQFGSNNQTLELLVDLGELSTWVRSSSNPFCSEVGEYVNQPLLGHDLQVSACTSNWLFNTSDSTSLNVSDSIFTQQAYFSNLFVATDNGYYASDVISVGGQRVSNLVFGVSASTTYSVGGQISESEVKNISYLNLTRPAWNLGILSPLTNYSTTALMKQQGIINRNVFSVWLGSSASNDSEIIIGGVDHSKYEGDLLTVPITGWEYYTPRPDTFMVLLTGVSIYEEQNSAQIVECETVAALSDGLLSEMIGLPPDFLKVIVSSAGGKIKPHKEKQSSYYLPCNAAGGVTFNIAGAEINVPFREIIIPHRDSSSKYCATKFQEAYAYASLGIPFLRSTYTVFDIDNFEISFAKPRTNASTYSNTSVEAIYSNIPGARKASGYNQTYGGNGYSVRIVDLDSASNATTAAFTSKMLGNSASVALPGLLLALFGCFI